MESTAPSPEMVTAARSHLTGTYARGVDRLLWETEKRPMADADVIQAVLTAAATGAAVDKLDLGAALVLTQALRLHLDHTEYDLLEACRGSGMPDEATAAVLELPDGASVAARHRWLRGRRDLPRAENGPPAAGTDVGSAAKQAAARAERRADQARTRAASAATRRRELGRIPPPAPATAPATGREHAERAAALASEARVLADESYERVALGLLRAADRLDTCAAACQHVADTTGTPEQRRHGQEYHQAAERYRELAANYRNLGAQSPLKGDISMGHGARPVAGKWLPACGP